MERVNRDFLLQKLESVAPGLDKKGGVEQSDCFVFDGGRVITFNDEISCSIDSPLNGFTGAVKAKALLEILGKLTEDEISIDPGDGELVLKGQKRRAGVVCEAEILMPVSDLDLPEEWEPLPVDFCEAVGIVKSCAAKDDNRWILTCIHIHPEWIEACDDVQFTRYEMDTGFDEPLLIRASSLKHIVELGMIECGETDEWLHFRNAAGLVMSCRKQLGAEDYPDLTSVHSAEGERAVFPKGLSDGVEKARVFSSENTDSDRVEVELRPGKLKLSGRGTSGWYEEIKAISYDGPKMKFLISPKLLTELVERAHECEVTDSMVIVDSGKFKYIATLMVPE